MFYICVHSGLNNKLIPLLSLLRIAKKENRKILCYWDNDAYLSKSLFKFNDLFENIKEIKFISKNEFYKQYYNINNFLISIRTIFIINNIIFIIILFIIKIILFLL